ncbi:hypothetical protein, partial [Salmonella enterica]|uniref:hypothetical protein n=1 Tax=Salmonella enterica TaxID=28901 RepID=UPI00398C2D09
FSGRLFRGRELGKQYEVVQAKEALRRPRTSLGQTDKVVVIGHGAGHLALAAVYVIKQLMTVLRFPP